ncbi:LacI family DNA-binding transcriptional regulator [Diplocloster agilis]|uniref:LacI family transcriptional regulator n=1 Tax=Diplocloster agilis TaxID=2850323 RepID=A0A949K8Y7_9FIRM|nr:LacI family DNA-binding transcriptional regulator [Diplocloster agilis]MBU9739603.1 LacI family transcriptional regulator [Diplocloster agilis]
MANIKDVARQAGVSISTVSRVINDSKSVSSPLRVKVEKAIDDLNYSTNSIARGLKSSQTNNIAVILTSVSRTFFSGVLEGINKEADQEKYSVFISETHDSIEREIKLVRSCASQWVDGIILASSAYGNDMKTRKYIESLSSLEKKDSWIPVVTLEYPCGNPGVDAVVVDHKKSAFRAVDYLIREVGRKNIIHISLPFEHYMGQQRIAGYREALEKNGLIYTEDQVLEGDYTSYCGYTLTKDLVRSGQPFDAVFCANDQMAVGVLQALGELGIQVPEQVAVMGNDDIFAASIVKPSLTSIHVPRFEMGAAAMKHMLELIREGEPSAKRKIITLDTEIVERESTKRGLKNSLQYLDW